MMVTSPNSNGWRINKWDDNHIWFIFGVRDSNGGQPGLPTTLISKTTVETGTWYHIAAVKSDDEIVLYINGIREAAKPVPTFNDDNSADLRIGSESSPQRRLGTLSGLIDEVSLYNRALGHAEIEGVYRSRPPTEVAAIAPAGVAPRRRRQQFRAALDWQDACGGHARVHHNPDSLHQAKANPGRHVLDGCA